MSEALVQQAYVNGSSTAQDVSIWYAQGSAMASAGRREFDYKTIAELQLPSTFSTLYIFWLRGTVTLMSSTKTAADNITLLSMPANTGYTSIWQESNYGLGYVTTSNTLQIQVYSYDRIEANGKIDALGLLYSF